MKLGQSVHKGVVDGMVYYRPPLPCWFGHQEQTTVKAWAEWNWLDSSLVQGQTFSEPFGICGLLIWFTSVAIVTNGILYPTARCIGPNGLRL